MRGAKRLIIITGLFLLALQGIACSREVSSVVKVTGTAPSGVDATPTRSTKPPALVLGSSGNPLILALPPGTSTHGVGTGDPNLIAQGQALAEGLSRLSDYAVVTVTPASYGDLVGAMRVGNVHIAVLPPLVYLLAHEQTGAWAMLMALHNGSQTYGAQFIVIQEAGFKTFFNPVTGKNTADAATALAQFEGKQPCWTEPDSPSGYVIPAGYLAEYGIQTQPPIILREHTNVVRAVYAKDICDFGATYIDARSFPLLLQEHPDVLEQVLVIWRIPPIIPNESIVYAGSLPAGVGADLTRAFLEFADSAEGQDALMTIYQIEELRVIDESLYNEFQDYVGASGLQLDELVK
jgi:phosphonate transport system substrate-binding protein